MEYTKKCLCNMNLFFLSMDPAKIAGLYCDQHVIKILLEACQMLYTAWFFSGEHESVVCASAPFTKSGDRRGYKPAHKGHPMTMWVASDENNYRFTVKVALALAEEYTRRFCKQHACEEHVHWLASNTPQSFEIRVSPKAYYAIEPGVTPIPECMPDVYKGPNIIEAYRRYYLAEKMMFARYQSKVHDFSAKSV